MKHPLQVGVTGGIGSGKSLVCRLFACLKVPIYEADERAKWLTEHDPELREAISTLLGAEAYTPEGRYHRPYVAARVFGNAELLKSLNALIHPRVQADYAAWVACQAKVPYVVKEAALMNKAGHHNTLDYVVVVQAPAELRLQRIRQRDPHRDDAQIRAIMAQQLPDAERLALADFVLTNDDTLPLIPQVLRLHEFFLKTS